MLTARQPDELSVSSNSPLCSHGTPPPGRSHCFTFHWALLLYSALDAYLSSFLFSTWMPRCLADSFTRTSGRLYNTGWQGRAVASVRLSSVGPVWQLPVRHVSISSVTSVEQSATGVNMGVSSGQNQDTSWRWLTVLMMLQALVQHPPPRDPVLWFMNEWMNECMTVASSRPPWLHRHKSGSFAHVLNYNSTHFHLNPRRRALTNDSCARWSLFSLKLVWHLSRPTVRADRTPDGSALLIKPHHEKKSCKWAQTAPWIYRTNLD